MQGCNDRMERTCCSVLGATEAKQRNPTEFSDLPSRKPILGQSVQQREREREEV
jgi:hypothetical protein